MKKHISNSYHF